MNNTKITLVALFAITFATTFTIAIAIPEADAHDSNSSILTLYLWNSNDGTRSIWYDLDSLALVTLDGQSNSVGMRLTGEVGRQAVDNTDMTIAEANNYSTGINRFDAAYIGDALTFGYTPYFGSGSNMYKVIYFNTNDDLDYDTSAGCTGW